jgi:hypothetical protein
MLLLDIYYHLQAALILAAATALYTNARNDAARFLCFTSIVCSLGSAVGSNALLTRFQNVNAMRLAWFEGGVLFVVALSTPGAWLRWAVVSFLGAFLTHLWKTQPQPANAVVLVLVAIQFVLFVYQSHAFRDRSQGFNVSRPLRIDYYHGSEGVRQTYARKDADSNPIPV